MYGNKPQYYVTLKINYRNFSNGKRKFANSRGEQLISLASKENQKANETAWQCCDMNHSMEWLF